MYFFRFINKTTSLRGLRVTTGLPFGPLARQKLDVYTRPQRRAARLAGRRLPVIVFFYGGYWRIGERQGYRFLAARLARRGYTVVVPDYRLVPEVKFPAFLQDCAAAVGWVFKHVQEYGGDDGSVFLMGHSAGGYNAAMLALDAQYLRAEGLDPSRLAGWIGLAGLYDFHPFEAVFAEPFGTAADASLTQPVNHVHPGAPPALLLHGGRDDIVVPRNTTSLAARLRQAANAVETRIYPKLGHVAILTAFLPYLRWQANPLRDLRQFIAACRNGDFAEPLGEVSAPVGK